MTQKIPVFKFLQRIYGSNKQIDLDRKLNMLSQTKGKAAALSSDLGKCLEKNCTMAATIDYNGHGHFVCPEHYRSLSHYFDQEYN